MSDDVDNKYLVINASYSMELQLSDLIQELKFFYAVLDISFVLKSKNYYQ